MSRFDNEIYKDGYKEIINEIKYIQFYSSIVPDEDIKKYYNYVLNSIVKEKIIKCINWFYTKIVEEEALSKIITSTGNDTGKGGAKRKKQKSKRSKSYK